MNSNKLNNINRLFNPKNIAVFGGNDAEIVIMKNVSAVFTDKKNNRIHITSDFASFNSSVSTCISLFISLLVK